MFLASLYGVSISLVLAGVAWLWQALSPAGPGLWLAGLALLLAPALVAACFRDEVADAPGPSRHRAWARWRRPARHAGAPAPGRRSTRAASGAPQDLAASIDADGRPL